MTDNDRPTEQPRLIKVDRLTNDRPAELSTDRENDRAIDRINEQMAMTEKLTITDRQNDETKTMADRITERMAIT